MTDRGSGLRASGSAVKPIRPGKMRLAAFAVLIVVVVLVGGNLAGWMFSGGSPPSSGSPPVSAEATAQLPQAEPIAAAPSSKHGQPANAAGLELAGIVVTGRDGMAIIADAGSAQKVYRVGQSVRPGLMLKEVFPDAVILDSGGLSERLALGTGDASADAILADGRAPRPMESATAQPASTPEASSVQPGQRLNLDPAIGARFALEPDGGFRLQRAKQDSVYASMGLRAGDVVRRLNGSSVESPKQLMALYRQLKQGGQGEVEVLRDGRLEVLRYGERP